MKRNFSGRISITVNDKYEIKDNLEWACSNAQGQDTIIEIADVIHSALNGTLNTHGDCCLKLLMSYG